MIDSKQAARLRYRKSKGAKLKPAQTRALDEYEQKHASKPSPQPASESDAGGGAPQPSDSVPSDAPITQPEAGAPPVEPVESEPIEAPPPVISAKPASSSKGGAWQDKYRASAGPAADGREMLCVFIGSQWKSALAAMEEDLAKVGVKPVVSAEQLFPVIVLALDQILPERAKLTPPIAAAVGSTITTVQRFYHHKKIAEVQKADGTLDDYKRKAAAEAERKRAAERAAEAEAELVNEAPATPTHAAPPPEAPPTLEQVHSAPPPRTPTPPTPTNGIALGVAADGKLYG